MKVIIRIILILFSAGNLFAAGNEPIDLDLESRATDFIKSKPVQFVENKGQMTDMDGRPISFVLFRVETPGMNLFITEEGITYCFYELMEEHKKGYKSEKKISGPESEEMKVKWSRIDMDLEGASIKKGSIITEGKSEYFDQYFLEHCSNGITDVRSYTKVTIKDVYPGIDWVFYNAGEKGFKYDFIVHPGADPYNIELIYSSLHPLRINKRGDIEIKTRSGTLTENAPVSFADEKKIETQFIKTLNKKNENGGYDTHIKFRLSNFEYLASQTLVIDPQLVWATFYGGAGADGPQSVDCDINGNVYITGYTQQFGGFPTQQHTGNPSAYYNNTLGAGGIVRNIFILKFSSTGVRIWATYYTSNGDWATGYSVKTDNAGNVLIVGTAGNIPTQTYSTNATAYYNNTNPGGFILKFDNMGNRIWATYYPGTMPREVALDAAGNIYITGSADASFVTQAYAGNPTAYYQSTITAGNQYDAFILKFSNVGNIIWATFYGGSGSDQGTSIYIDVSGNIYASGNTSSTDLPLQSWGGAFNQPVKSANTDIFILRFTSTGIRTWATFYGGNNNEEASSIRTDASGNIFVGGLTSSTNFPVQASGTAYFQAINAGSDDAFILRFDASGIRTWATYYGDVGIEDMYSYDNLEIDKCGNVYFGFDVYENSPNVFTFNPGCGSFYKGVHSPAARDVFYVKFSNSGNVLWASYWGGTGRDFASAIAINTQGDLYIAGEWGGYNSSVSVPVTNPGAGAYFQGPASTNDDGYIARFTPDPPPTITPSQVNSTSCSPCNGSATVSVGCGTPNYSYVWSNGSSSLGVSSNTNTISGLCPGTYSVTVTSVCSQTLTSIFVIIGTNCNSCNLAGSFTKGTSGCTGCGCKEWVMVNATGGTSPYTYTWPDGYVNRYKNQLCPGSYTINIKDKNGCSVSINLSAP